MCKNELGLLAVLGASCFAAVLVIGHILRALDPPSGVANLLGAMSFALAVVIESDG